MFLRQLEYLVALAQEQHFTRAALHCNVSQPSLSNAIKQLERELGTPIVLRHQRFQGFTARRQHHRMSKRILPTATPAAGAVGAEEEPLRPPSSRGDADELADPALHQPSLFSTFIPASRSR